VNDHRLEVAEIFRRYGEKFLSQWGHTLSAEQRKALRDIGVCRTAALGAHLEQCDACGHQRPAYDSSLWGVSSNGEQTAASRAKVLSPLHSCSP